MKTGWRALGVFWAAVFGIFALGAVVLQTLGPPTAVAPRQTSARPPAHAPAPAASVTPAPARPVVVEERRGIPDSQRPGRATPGPIADPDPALQEPAGEANATLPRIAADGRMAMQVYAAGFDRSSRRPRVGLLIAGFGLNEAESNKALRDLPGGVSFAVSPYATGLDTLLSRVRFAEHEYLLSVPMEPQIYPLNDPGPRALMTNQTADENLQRLSWALSRIAGYVGVTGALGAMRGERFAAQVEQMDPVLAEVGRRGLLYIDPRPGVGGGAARLPHVWSRDVDLVVDEPVEDIDARLADLERLARDKGSALGLAGAPRPVTVQRILLWSNGLTDRGLILAPVSALVLPPEGTASAAK